MWPCGGWNVLCTICTAYSLSAGCDLPPIFGIHTWGLARDDWARSRAREDVCGKGGSEHQGAVLKEDLPTWRIVCWTPQQGRRFVSPRAGLASPASLWEFTPFLRWKEMSAGCQNCNTHHLMSILTPTGFSASHKDLIESTKDIIRFSITLKHYAAWDNLKPWVWNINLFNLMWRIRLLERGSGCGWHYIVLCNQRLIIISQPMSILRSYLLEELSCYFLIYHHR